MATDGNTARTSRRGRRDESEQTGAEPMIRVLLVDDHELVRTGIRRLLEDRGEAESIVVVGEADSGEQALEQVKTLTPDVILMDLNMPGIGGLEALRRMLRHDARLKVIVVTVHAEGPFPKRLLEAGAMGYLTKGCDIEEMITAIRRVHAGERHISPEIAQQLALSMLPGGEPSPLDRLSQREIQILLMLTQGYKAQAISDKLCLSPKTVSTYRQRIYEKLGVESDVGLTKFAMRQGLLSDDV
jgi:two-component system invasion response regulator UvrY